MKDIHALINELGASLSENEKEEAMMILNQMYLNGYDDLFICIALIRVLGRDDFIRNSYLFGYQPFLDEVEELKKTFLKVKDINKEFRVSAVYESKGDTLSEYDRALIEEYGELFNYSDNEEVKNNSLDYLYMKYCFSYTEILNCNIVKYKKLFRETNDAEISNF